MIIRVFRALVHPNKQQDFEQFFMNKALPNIQAQAGLVSVMVGKPLATSPTEFLMVTVWQDINALKGFAGEQWQNAVIDPDEVDLLKETFVYHYEATHPQAIGFGARYPSGQRREWLEGYDAGNEKPYASRRKHPTSRQFQNENGD